MKVCPKCGKRKKVTTKNFSVPKSGKISWCRECDTKSAVSWAKRNPEKARRNRKNYALKSRYGVTVEAYEALLSSQGGVCAICQKPPEATGSGSVLHVDHDHKTGAVRGLLCFPCNAGLGNMKDDPALLRSGANYLERWKAVSGNARS